MYSNDLTCGYRTQAGLDAVLSSRETEILAALRRGLSNRQIADSAQLSENTVKFHLKNVFRKLGVKHRTQAVLVAISREAVEVAPKEAALSLPVP